MRSYIGQSWNGGHLSYHVGWLKKGCFPQNLCISGLGSMYSCILYSCTRVHISEYSDALYTHVLLAWYSVLVLEYIHKVLVLSEYISQYFSINNAIIFILMIYLEFCITLYTHLPAWCDTCRHRVQFPWVTIYIYIFTLLIICYFISSQGQWEDSICYIGPSISFFYHLFCVISNYRIFVIIISFIWNWK